MRPPGRGQRTTPRGTAPGPVARPRALGQLLWQGISPKKHSTRNMDLDALVDYLQGHATARHVHVDQLDEAAPAARSDRWQDLTSVN